MAKTTRPLPGQERLLVHSIYGQEAIVPNYELLECSKIDLNVSKEFLLGSLDALGEVGQYLGFEKALHSDRADDLQGERSLKDIVIYYDGIKAANAASIIEHPKHKLFRGLFEVATGYKTIEPNSDLPLEAHQVLGKKALRKFKDDFVGKEKEYARSKFRKQLDPTGEIREKIRSGNRRHQKRRVVTGYDLPSSN